MRVGDASLYIHLNSGISTGAITPQRLGGEHGTWLFFPAAGPPRCQAVHLSREQFISEGGRMRLYLSFP
jgi:hypothetical protein